jgi:hypothetical protein
VGCLACYALVRLVGPRVKGPTVPLVELGVVNLDEEEAFWRAALSSAGVWFRVQHAGWIPGTFMRLPYTTTFWVKQADYEFARKVVGYPQ